MHLPTHFWVTIGQAILIFVVSGLIVRLGARLMRRLELRSSPSENQIQARRATLYRLLTSVLRYTIDFVALVMVLDLFGVPTASLIAGAGVLGLAVSFGAQGLVQDIVTGMFLLYEDQYAVGDQITLPALSTTGIVSELGIRVTRLSGPTGETIIIPNRLILEVQNHSRDQTAVSVVVPVSPKVNPELVYEVFDSSVRDLQKEVPTAKFLGVSGFAPGQVQWLITAQASYGDQYRVDRLIRLAVTQAMYKNKIDLAEL